MAIPDIGFPIGRKFIELDGMFIREKFKYGKLIGWRGRNNERPVIEYPDGTQETVESLALTNWAT